MFPGRDGERDEGKRIIRKNNKMELSINHKWYKNVPQHSMVALL